MKRPAALLLLASCNVLAAPSSSSTSSSSPAGAAAQPSVLQPLPQIRDAKDLERCMSPAEAKVLLEGMIRRLTERSLSATADIQRELKNLNTQVLGAETEYQLCMKREQADLAGQSKDQPLPCTVEREAFFEARMRIGREGPNARKGEILARMQPIYVEEIAAMEAELHRRCAEKKAQ